MNYLFEISASIVECCIIVRLCNGFLGFRSEKNRWLKSLSFFAALTVFDIFLSQIDFMKNIYEIFMLLLILAYAMLFLAGKVYEKILLAILPAITSFPINLTVISLFGTLSGKSAAVGMSDGIMRFPVLFISKLAFFFASEILIRLRKKSTYSLDKFQWAIQLLCFVLSFLITHSLWRISRKWTDTAPRFLVVYLLIAVLNILLYILLNKMQREHINKEEFNHVKASLLSQEKFMIETRERYTEMKTLRHDVKHYLMTVADLLSVGNVDGAISYIEEVINEKMNPAVVGVNTGSAVIDAVINRKLTFCAGERIEMKCLIDSLMIFDYELDIGILLSNLLDNAISGCSSSAHPKIELTMKHIKSFTYIMAKNSIASSVLMSNPMLETGKENKIEHGFGIRSMKDIVKKYEGSMKFKEENDQFIVEIWLELKNAIRDERATT